MTLPKWTGWLHHSTDFRSCLEASLFSRMRPDLQHIRLFVDGDIINHQDWRSLGSRRPCDNNFVQECLDGAMQDDVARALSDLERDADAASMARTINTTRDNDGDSGPELVCRWAYRDMVVRHGDEGRSSRCLARNSLRSCAYVFIDLERARRWFPLDRKGRKPEAESHPDSSCARYRKFCQMIDEKMNNWAVTGVPLD